MSYVSPPKGGADVQDALMSTQRRPNYTMRDKGLKNGVSHDKVDNISGYVDKNLRKVDKPRHGEHR